MHRPRFLPILAVAIALFAVGVAPSPAEEFRRTILVPAFDGGEELGIRVANVLALQISRTFRASDDRAGEPFGRGLLVWDAKPLAEMRYEEAMRRALNIGTLAHLVLWGRAYRVGEDVVVQAFLTATPVLFELTDPRREVWTVEHRLAGRDEVVRLSTDLPSSHFAFAPVLLSRDAVQRYQSIPALQIFADRRFTQPVGRIGAAFRALRYEGDAVQLRSGPVVGWVPLPDLSEGESEVSIFASALFRLLRTDWRGASDLFARTLEMPRLPLPIRIDSLLLQGLAQEKQGTSGLESIQKAYELNPYRVESCRYLVQAWVAELGRKPEDVGARAETRRVLAGCRALLDSESEWLNHADSIVASLEH